ncbi:MAG: hypothetical protein IPF62_08030 [Bacteroidetes bacterium]|nr:hypothetical protein [Bacteroidota bacterium]
MKNILLSLVMLFCLSASSQNNYRLYSRLGLDLMEQNDYGYSWIQQRDSNGRPLEHINMTIETAVQTKWKSGAKTNSRSSDEMKVICLEGYITKYDFNATTGFHRIELSSKTGSKINCYFPYAGMKEMMLENVGLDVEENRAMCSMEKHYNAIYNDEYHECIDMVDLMLWSDSDLNSGERCKIAEENKVQIFGYLLLDANNKAEIQPMIEITWKKPTLKQIEQYERDGRNANRKPVKKIGQTLNQTMHNEAKKQRKKRKQKLSYCLKQKVNGC